MHKIFQLIQTLWNDLLTNPWFYVRYVAVGSSATLLDTWLYHAAYDLIGIPNVLSVAIAWVFSTSACFWGYRLWVFRSKETERKGIFREFWSFMGLRLFTCLLDMGIMYVAVDVMDWPHILWKLISCAICTVLNFLASKFFIFTKTED